MRLRNLVFSVAVVVALVMAVPAFAQQANLGGVSGEVTASPNVRAAEPAPDPMLNSTDQWGTSNWETYEATAFDAALRAGAWGDHNGSYIQSLTTANVSVGWPVHLPSGAVVEYVRLFYNEPSASYAIGAGFYRFSDYGTNGLIQACSPTAAITSDTWIDFGPFSEVVDNSPNFGYTYNILAIWGGDTKIYKWTIWYLRQVAPAPATATFSDVPTSYWAFRYIEALNASGITGGCGSGNYCPENYVKRSEMAVFLSKALGLYFPY